MPSLRRPKSSKRVPRATRRRSPSRPAARRGSNRPAARRPAGPAARPAARSASPRGVVRRLPGVGVLGWRAASLLIVLGIVAFSIVLFSSPSFYVTRVDVGGVRYVPAEEVFAQSEVAGYHVLWVDPEAVAEQVAKSPSLESAEVYVQWPARLIVLVEEREPAIVWEQLGAQYWVDAEGNFMVLREPRPELVRVINEGDAIPFRCPGPACPDEGTVTIDPAVVHGVQQLKALRGNIDVLYYDPMRGLSYQDGRGWRGYFGVGSDMDLKLAIYETLIDDLESRGILPTYVDVSNPDAPFYRVSQPGG